MLVTRSRSFVVSIYLTRSLTQTSQSSKAMPESKVQAIVEVTKSPNDDRAYRGMVLNNGMKVLLVSDPSTDKSAAALDVRVG